MQRLYELRIREDNMAHKQLTDEERYQIEALKRDGFNQSEIARSLKRHPSTINRELARNSDHKGYRGKLAVNRTDRRRQVAKKSEKMDSAMCSMINALLVDISGLAMRIINEYLLQPWFLY